MKPRKPVVYAPKLVVLWDHEIKQAVKAIHFLKVFGEEKREETPENIKIWADLMIDAIKACAAALYHPTILEEDSAITVMVATGKKK